MIFKKIKLNKINLGNRITISPMCQYSSKKDGTPSYWHYVHLSNMINSGASLLTLESTSISKIGRISVKDLCLYNSNQKNKLKKLFIYLKKMRNIPIVLQISHSGRKGSSNLPWSKEKGPLKKTKGAWLTISPSSLRKDKGWPIPKEIKKKEIKKIIKQFSNCARYAKQIGFDGLEIHMAHGYLIHQFLSPISNKRKDEYGGNFENRSKFAVEIIKEIKKIWPRKKILGARITGTDHLKNGIDIKDSIKLVKKFEKLGLDYVCVSSGGIITKTNMNNKKNGFRVNIASKIKKNTKLKVRTSGNLKSISAINYNILKKKFDFVAVARPFLQNPYWLFQNKDFIKNFKCSLPTQIKRGF